MMGKRRSPAGFTLLEVMVAVAVIAIALVAVFQLHAQTVSMGSVARFYATAPMLAQARISEIETAEPGDFRNDSGDFGNDLAGYVWTSTVEDIESEVLGRGAEALKRIEITVEHEGEGLRYQFRTYRMLPE